jgi:hypothetical protein
MRVHLFPRAVLPLILAAVLHGHAIPAEGASPLTLAWDANSEADLAGYLISYGRQPGAYTTSVDVGNRTSWVPSGLQAGQRYYFAIQAYNTAGLFSAHSNEITVVPEYPLPAPTVTGVSPSSGSANGGMALTITGTNFMGGATVLVGSKAALNTVVVSSTRITAVTPPGAAGVVDVRVINLDAQSGVKYSAYTYISNVVTITSVYPATGLSRGGTALTIKGTNFGQGASVFVGGIAATNVRVVGSTLIAATAPAHSAGLVDVRVTLPDGRAGTASHAFTYVNGKPVVSLVTPKRGTIRGGTLVTVSGANFVAGTVITFGGRPATNVNVVNATTLTAMTPLDAAAPQNGGSSVVRLPHTVEVRAETPDGQSATLATGYIYDLVAPTVMSTNPVSGSVKGGTQVAIRGTEFASGAAVFFGTTLATDVVVVSPTSITAVTPPHVSGVVDVLVRNADGLQGSRQRGFTYIGENATVDTDRDGMPDVFEDRFGLDPNLPVANDGASGDPDSDGRTNLQEYNEGTHPRGFVKRYFSEGVSSTFFSTVFALINPGDEPAHVLMQFMRSNGSVYGHPLIIAPKTRATINSRSIPAIATVDYSTTIESDQVIVADRTTSWDASGYGAHAETAIEKPSTVWYLAEGATHSGFDLFYLIQNPTSKQALFEVRYLLPSGAQITKSYTSLPNSRFNIWVNHEHPSLADTDVSGVVTATNGVPLIVERSMYLNGTRRTFEAGHNSAGVTTPATRWFLAEGSTGRFFDEFILLANPEPKPAQVKASFMLPNGETLERHYTVPPTSRYNIWVDQEDAKLEASAVSTEIESTNGVPIIVERTMWWPGPTAAQWSEAHNSPGAVSTSTRWAVAEGEQGGPQQRSTYILLANTSPYYTTAQVTLLFENGQTASKLFSLLPQSRFNVSVGDEFPEAANRRFGAVIESLGDTPGELVVERAMYWNANQQFWAAGTNALGTPLQ